VIIWYAKDVLCSFDGSLFCGRAELSRFSSTVSPTVGLRHGDVSMADVGLGAADARDAEDEINATGKITDAEASASTSFREAEEIMDLLPCFGLMRAGEALLC
jgi:hypothetical protein